MAVRDDSGDGSSNQLDAFANVGILYIAIEVNVFWLT